MKRTKAFLLRSLSLAVACSAVTLECYCQSSERALVECAAVFEVPPIRRTDLQESAGKATISVLGRIEADGKLRVHQILGGSTRMQSLLSETVRGWKFRNSCKNRQLRIEMVIVDNPEPVYSIDWVTYSFVYPNRFVFDVIDGRKGR